MRAKPRSLKEEATELNILGFLYRQAGKMQKALEYLNQALPIEQNENNQAAQAMTENTMGRVYTDLGQEEQSAGAVQPGAADLALAGNSAGPGSTLNNMGRAYNNLGRAGGSAEGPERMRCPSGTRSTAGAAEADDEQQGPHSQPGTAEGSEGA